MYLFKILDMLFTVGMELPGLISIYHLSQQQIFVVESVFYMRITSNEVWNVAKNEGNTFFMMGLNAPLNQLVFMKRMLHGWVFAVRNGFILNAGSWLPMTDPAAQRAAALEFTKATRDVMYDYLY